MTPQQIDAMKLALEALEYWDVHGKLHQPTEEAITALEEALAQSEQEFVALHVYKPTLPRGHIGNVSDGDLPWVYDQDPSSGYSARMLVHTTPPQPEQEPVAIKRMKEWVEYLKRKSDFGQHMKIPSEMSAGACWELAIELEQFINTTPPQRKPLTDEQIEQLEQDTCAMEFPETVRAIEAAHDIKDNT